MTAESQVSRRTFLAATVGAAVALPAASAGGTEKSGTVQTVLGPLSTSKLGFHQSHEHVCAFSPGLWNAWPELMGGRDPFIKRAVEKLKTAKAEGLDSFVDLTTIDLGRDIRLLEEISRKSGVHVIPATGHWVEPSRCVVVRTVEELTDFFVREVQVGIEGTDIKAGVIKAANDAGPITPFGEKLLRAAAHASIATGTPISTHSLAIERIGDKQAAIFEEEHVNPTKVCIGHSSDTADMDYLTGLARRGYYLGMDRMKGGADPPKPRATFHERLVTIKALVDAGFGDRVMLGTDYGIGSAQSPTVDLRMRDTENPDGILFVLRQVIPGLRNVGVQEAAIRMITTENPKRFFDGA
jgi:phosphotriesterase-related protein